MTQNLRPAGRDPQISTAELPISTMTKPASSKNVKGRDFVVLSDDWNGLPTSTIHLFRRILPNNRVFWLRIVNRWPRLNWADARKIVGVLRGWCVRPSISPRSLPSCPNHSPILHTPLMMPSFGRVFRRLNQFCLGRAYRQLCEAYEIKSPILVTTFPSTADFIKSAKARLKIYYCVDDWLSYPGLDHTRLGSMEHNLLRTVDAIVVTSRKLEEKNRRGCPSLYLPQGVDFDHFAGASSTCDLVPEMVGVKKPIVGFFGLISEWIDLDLIRFLSQQFPSVSFVLIGSSELSSSILSECPNVYRTGPIEYGELPRWARCFDVGLIPFRLNELTKAVNPLKLMEYYALGLPVLSTRLPDLEDMPGPLFLANSHHDFRDALATILGSDLRSFAERGQIIARANSWQHRVEQLSTFIEEML